MNVRANIETIRKFNINTGCVVSQNDKHGLKLMEIETVGSTGKLGWTKQKEMEVDHSFSIAIHLNVVFVWKQKWERPILSI